MQEFQASHSEKGIQLGDSTAHHREGYVHLRLALCSSGGFIFICESVSGVCVCGREKEHSNSCSKAVLMTVSIIFSQMMEKGKFIPLIILPQQR